MPSHPNRQVVDQRCHIKFLDTSLAVHFTYKVVKKHFALAQSATTLEQKRTGCTGIYICYLINLDISLPHWYINQTTVVVFST